MRSRLRVYSLFLQQTLLFLIEYIGNTLYVIQTVIHPVQHPYTGRWGEIRHGKLLHHFLDMLLHVSPATGDNRLSFMMVM
jgi:hypothetical protein